MIPYFLKKTENDSVLFNLDDKELIFFIPSLFFDRKFARNIEGKVQLFGMFNYIIRDIKTGKDSELYAFNYPTVFETSPSSMTTIRDMEYKGLAKDDYTLLKYTKGDTVLVSTKLIQDVENVEIFYKMFNSGKIPNSVPYDQLQNIFTENISLNGKNYNLNMQLFGFIIGEMATVKDDVKTLFRHSDMKDLYAYDIKNIKLSPKQVSAYSSFTSEVYDDAVINASMVKNNSSSPMEKLFMGY